MNSKLYPCKECGQMVEIRSKNLCAFCRQKQKGSQVKRYIFKQTLKNKLKKQDKMVVLEPFFKFHMENVAKRPFCENCGCRIQGNLCNLAHILPKGYGKHTEVMGELDNCLYLCASVNGGEERGCHDRYDKIQATHSVYLMNCWSKAVEKYLKFRENVTKNTKYKQVFETWIEENVQN